MGSRYFSKVQFGKESTRGTAVPADTILLGRTPAVNSDTAPVYPREDVGINAPAVRSVKGGLLYMNTLSSEHGYFQLLPALFGCGLKGGVTATETTASQGDYAWAFTPSLTAANSPDSLTIELGDDTQAFEAEYAMFERIRISGEVAQGMEFSPVNVEADFFGRQLTPTSFTGSISLPTAETINAKLARFYLDTSWSGVGGTEKANILRSFDIEIVTGVKPVFAGSAYRYFNTHSEGLIEVTASFVFEGNSDADAIFDAHQANTFQVARLKVSGAQIGSGVNHSLTLDIGGTWQSVSPLSSEDRNNNLHAATLYGFYDPTGAKMLQANVVTNVSAY